MRTLCFGGTFNPIHHGHLICARAVAETAGFNRVMLIPGGQPPHKQGVSDIAPAQDRSTMCRLAVAGDPLFEVNDLELRRNGPTYTLDTANLLLAGGLSSIHWLIGADMAQSLPYWHNADELLTAVQFVLMARPGWSFEWSSMPLKYRHLEQHIVTSPLIDLSSTDIRRRVREGKSIEYLVPASVSKYIIDKRLY